MNLGDLLIVLTPDTMATATREGLIRRWSAPHLAQSERQGRYQAAAEAALAKNWDERRAMFVRAQTAEDEGRLSLAVELYGALGRTDDVRRLLQRQKEVEVTEELERSLVSGLKNISTCSRGKKPLHCVRRNLDAKGLV